MSWISDGCREVSRRGMGVAAHHYECDGYATGEDAVRHYCRCWCHGQEIDAIHEEGDMDEVEKAMELR